MSNLQPSRFAFHKIVVGDLQKTATFYRSVMGYGEGQFIEGEISGRPIEEIVFFNDSGQTEFLILAYKDTIEPQLATGGSITGIFTPDIEEFERGVLAAGGSIAQPIGPIDLGSRQSLVAFYTDPEGHLLEVIQS